MTADLDAAIQSLRDRITSVPAGQWDTTSPGEGWTVAQVLHHAVTGLTYNADLMFQRPRRGEPIQQADHDAFIAETAAFSTTSAEPLLALLDDHEARMRSIFAADNLSEPYRLTFASGNTIDYTGAQSVQSAVRHIHEHVEQASTWLR